MTYPPELTELAKKSVEAEERWVAFAEIRPSNHSERITNKITSDLAFNEMIESKVKLNIALEEYRKAQSNYENKRNQTN